jgi:nucleotide-binding universal stress UspA family protein
MFKHILVPTDGSPLSRRAVERAVRFAREQKARVTGFWVGPAWEPNLYAYSEAVPAGFVSPRRHAARVRQAAARQLAAVEKAAAAAGVRCKCAYVTGGLPYAEIVNAARRYGCDLIVMASHSRGPVSRLLLGSQTNKVLAYSRIPVMVCR